jgi:hypothetical protein
MSRLKKNHLLLILSSFFVFLEWPDQHYFIFQIELELFSKLFIKPSEILHPFIIIPFGAQLLLLFSVLKKRTNMLFSIFGIGGLLMLIGFVFFIGLITLNWKIILSCLPFFGFSILTIYNLFSINKKKQ